MSLKYVLQPVGVVRELNRSCVTSVVNCVWCTLHIGPFKTKYLEKKRMFEVLSLESQC